MRTMWIFLLAALGASCHDKTNNAVDAGAPDVSTVVDAAPDAAMSACVGTCRVFALVATKAAITVTFDRAYYGYNGPSANPTGIRIEAYHGGSADCPTMNSPTPQQTLIIPNVAVNAHMVATTSTTAKFTYLDFAGVLSTSPVVKSTAVNLSAIRVGFTAGDLFIAFDSNATMTEAITIGGHVVASHCASLDEMP
jgi:hypothetical protein